MTESLASNDPGAQKRRSTRITQAVPITVTGVDALGQPFKERTTTIGINCHGCKYQSKHYVPKNSAVTLEIPRTQPGQAGRTATGHVIWVQRPRTVRELFQIGVEFDIAGNIWGIAFPPDDWFPYPDDVLAQKPAEAGELAPANEGRLSAAETVPAEQPVVPPLEIPVVAPASQATPASGAPAAPAEGKIHVVPAPAPPAGGALAPAQDPLVSARQMAKMVAEAKDALDKTARRSAQTAINDEMTVVRQQLDAQLHEAVERAIKVSMERVSDSAVRKVVQQAAERTASIVEEARKATNANTAQLDARVREAVQQAVGSAAQEAARKAAEQATAANLKHAVEQAMERVLAEREASSPSLQILSSPDAAQAQLDQWKKKLEDTAQSTRDQALEQTKADIASATQRMQEEFQTALTGASTSISQTLSEAALAAFAKAEEEFAAKGTSLRATLDQTLANAHHSIQSAADDVQNVVRAATDDARKTARSIASEMEQERLRAEAAQAELRKSAQLAIDETRANLDQLLSSQKDQIARRTDEVITERTQLVEPMLRNSAEKILEHFGNEMDREIAPKIADAQRAAAELASTTRQAASIRENILEQTRVASEQAIQETMARLREEAAKVPAGIEEASRLALSKTAQDLEQKASETQHETYEALLKASDWYTKKAHTTMQSALEKAVEQSTLSLRDRAAEISSLAASELDHQRRSYVNHTQAQIEETAKEVMDRERGKLTENAEIASTGFANRLNQLTADSFQKFEESSRAALEKARADMEFVREVSFTEYEKRMEERIALGIEQARTQLQSQLVPLMEEWDAERESEKRVWMEALKKQTDESIEHYKSRLENASNSWLLASAATLGQNSQAMLDTLAKAAEKRIRETCAEVLAGMGDTIKDRLLGISSRFTPEDESGDLPGALSTPPAPKKRP